MPLPDADAPTDRLPLLAVDIETTGLDADHDRVLSIGWVPVDGRDIVLAGARYRIIRPDGDEPVGPSATVHKLTDDDVAAGIPLADAVAELLADLAGRVLLVHFARIETEFLGRACERLWGAGMPWPAVDTLQLQYRLVTTAWQPDPTAGALRLWTARERYGLPHTGPHHALADALACAELYLAQPPSSETAAPCRSDACSPADPTPPETLCTGIRGNTIGRGRGVGQRPATGWPRSSATPVATTAGGATTRSST